MDVQARECTGCGKIYIRPCNGEPSCPNFLWAQAQEKKAPRKKAVAKKPAPKKGRK